MLNGHPPIFGPSKTFNELRPLSFHPYLFLWDLTIEERNEGSGCHGKKCPRGIPYMDWDAVWVRSDGLCTINRFHHKF